MFMLVGYFLVNLILCIEYFNLFFRLEKVQTILCKRLKSNYFDYLRLLEVGQFFTYSRKLPNFREGCLNNQ